MSISSASENGNIPWYSEQCSSTLATTYSSGSSRSLHFTYLDSDCYTSNKSNKSIKYWISLSKETLPSPNPRGRLKLTP